MAFEVYNRKSLRNTGATPLGTIRNTGALLVNSNAYEMMEEPASVELLFDPRNKVVGLRGSDEYHAYKLTPLPGGWRSVSTGSMLSYYGVSISQSTRYEITYRDGVARIDLRKPLGNVARKPHGE